jgi:hypothetical protein
LELETGDWNWKLETGTGNFKLEETGRNWKKLEETGRNWKIGGDNWKPAPVKRDRATALDWKTLEKHWRKTGKDGAVANSNYTVFNPETGNRWKPAETG